MTKRQKYMKDYNNTYFKTKKGLIRKIFHHLKRNSIKRNHKLPNFTYEELFAWIINQNNFNSIYNEWVESNYNKSYVPSIDRIDNNLPYTFDNIQLVTFKQNCLNANNDIKYKKLYNSGLLNNGHRKICQYDLSGNKIEEFISLSEASRVLNIDHREISRCCLNKKNLYKKFFWCYKNKEDIFLKDLSNKIKKLKLEKNNKYIILKKDINTNITIKKYKTIKEACLSEKISYPTMTKILNDIKTKKELKYKFTKEYYEINE